MGANARYPLQFRGILWLLASMLVGALVPACHAGDGAGTQPSALGLSRYHPAGVYRFTSPSGSAVDVRELTEEVSAVTRDPDSGSLFVIGDEGRYLVEVDRRARVRSFMRLRGFRDTEGLSYFRDGRFLVAEEREQRVFRLTYVPGSEARRSALPFWTLGPEVGNSGLEGICYDPVSGLAVAVKEKSPLDAYELELLDPPAVRVTTRFTEGCSGQADRCWGVDDLADVAVLSSVRALQGTEAAGNLLLLSQASAKLVEVDRGGRILGELDLGFFSREAEGVTVDPQGTIYVVAESHLDSATMPQPIEASALLVLEAPAGARAGE
jgi:uncharacterized protein YjiK